MFRIVHKKLQRSANRRNVLFNRYDRHYNNAILLQLSNFYQKKNNKVITYNAFDILQKSFLSTDNRGGGGGASSTTTKSSVSDDSAGDAGRFVSEDHWRSRDWAPSAPTTSLADSVRPSSNWIPAPALQPCTRTPSITVTLLSASSVNKARTIDRFSTMVPRVSA